MFFSKRHRIKKRLNPAVRKTVGDWGPQLDAKKMQIGVKLSGILESPTGGIVLPEEKCLPSENDVGRVLIEEKVANIEQGVIWEGCT